MERIINKWKLNKGILASKMNMPLGTFCNKLSSKHTSEFSDVETIRLKMVLKEMGVDIARVTDIDFNDALKTIVKSKNTLTPVDKTYGMCKEKNCKRFAKQDYNGHGHYVCDEHYESLSRHFDDEYN